MKNISILGATGSIGKQTLDVIRAFPDLFRVVALTCRSNIALLKELIQEFAPLLVSVESETDAIKLRSDLISMKCDTEVLFGPEGNIACATIHQADLVVAAMVGMCGLIPVKEAIQAGKSIALANKETLVAGGSFIMELAKKYNVSILPVDSEHSAIWQCIRDRKNEKAKRIILTASGGPFRGHTKEMLQHVTIEQVLRHPTWTMGGKITVDSATMMNKGLEIIEASWLFDMPVDQIDVVVHPQSIIHSMVSMSDGSVLAQMGHPDMTLPIQVALFYPERGPQIVPCFNPFVKGANQLTFEPCDTEVFPALTLAYHAGRVGGSLPAVMNSANEEAVRAFLNGKIHFDQIIPAVQKCMENHEQSGIIKTPDLQSVCKIDSWARAYVQANLGESTTV